MNNNKRNGTIFLICTISFLVIFITYKLASNQTEDIDSDYYSGEYSITQAVFGVLIFIGIIALYMLPTIVAWNKRNINAIAVLNLFLGWTFIGWVVALVWASTKD